MVGLRQQTTVPVFPSNSRQSVDGVNAVKRV